MPLAGLYTRLSKDPGCDRLGVQRQERECRELCRRHGLEPAVYEDDDLSAYRPANRPAYERMLADIESGRLGAVVTWHTDRLYRHPQDLEALVDVAERRQIPLYTVAGGDLDLSTASGRMLARMLGAASRHEVERTAERIRAKHRELALAGRWAGGGHRPYGYDRDHKTVRPREAERIREAASRVLAGESLNAICVQWNATGVPGPTGGRWWPAALRNILSAARVSGRREMYGRDGSARTIGRITARATWPGIISVEESDRLRALFGTPGRLKASFARSHLLTGIAVCGACGTLLEAHGSSKSGQRRIGCKRGPGSTGCGRVSAVAGPLEDLVTEAVLQAVDQGALAQVMRSQDDPEALAELARVESQQAELAAEWAAERITAAEWRAARSVLEARERVLRQRVEALRRHQGLEGLPEPLRAAWPDLPLYRRRAVVKALVKAIGVQPGVRGRNYFDPDRVDITWRA